MDDIVWIQEYSTSSMQRYIGLSHSLNNSMCVKAYLEHMILRMLQENHIISVPCFSIISVPCFQLCIYICFKLHEFPKTNVFGQFVDCLHMAKWTLDTIWELQGALCRVHLEERPCFAECISIYNWQHVRSHVLGVLTNRKNVTRGAPIFSTVVDHGWRGTRLGAPQIMHSSRGTQGGAPRVRKIGMPLYIFEIWVFVWSFFKIILLFSFFLAPWRLLCVRGGGGRLGRACGRRMELEVEVAEGGGPRAPSLCWPEFQIFNFCTVLVHLYLVRHRYQRYPCHRSFWHVTNKGGWTY
jgi:hypothetical protein